MITDILQAVDANLEPLRQAKVQAEERLTNAKTKKAEAQINLQRGMEDAAHAHQLLADHDLSIKAQKAARAEARAKREVLAPLLLDDVERRHLVDNVEEADAALEILKVHDSKAAYDLMIAEGDVTGAIDNIYKAHVEGIANEMLSRDAVIRALHAELSSVVPSEINRPRTMAPPSPVVQTALGLIKRDDLHTPVNKLHGGMVTPLQFTPPDRGPKFLSEITENVAVPAEDDFAFVPAAKPQFGVKVK
jgi:hypothetical protein